MVYRLALEAPRSLRAAAVFAATVPVDVESGCAIRGRGVPMTIVAGTRDPVNPFRGGQVIGLNGRPLGRVHGAPRGAEWLAGLAGAAPEPRTDTILTVQAGYGVVRQRWLASDRVVVQLYTVYGAGHTVPGASTAVPAAAGYTERGFDGITEALDFMATAGARTSAH